MQLMDWKRQSEGHRTLAFNNLKWIMTSNLFLYILQSIVYTSEMYLTS